MPNTNLSDKTQIFLSVLDIVSKHLSSGDRSDESTLKLLNNIVDTSINLTNKISENNKNCD